MSEPKYDGMIVFIGGFTTSSSGNLETSGLKNLSQKDFIQDLNYKVQVKDWTEGGEILRDIKEFHQSNPDGKIVLLGHSVGGTKAYDLSENLSSEGIKTKLVTIDAVSSPLRKTWILPSNVEGLNVYSAKRDDEFSVYNVTEAKTGIISEKVGKDDGFSLGRVTHFEGAKNVPIPGVNHTDMDENSAVHAEVERFLKGADSRFYEDYVNSLLNQDITKYDPSENFVEQSPRTVNSRPESRNPIPLADDNTNKNFLEHKPLENPTQKGTDAQSSRPESHRAHPIYEEYVNKLEHKDWTKYDGSENSGVLLRQDGKSQPDDRSVTPMPNNNADKNFIEHKPLENPMQKETESLSSQPDGHKDLTKHDPTKNITDPVPTDEWISSDSRNFRELVGDIRENYRDDTPSGQLEFVEGTLPKEPTDLERNSINVGDAKSLDADTQKKSIGQRPSESGPNLGTQGNLSAFSEEATLTNKHPGKESMSPGDIKGQVDMIYQENPGELSSQKHGGITSFANENHLFDPQIEQHIDSLYESAAGDKNTEIEGYGFGGYSSNVKQDIQGIAAEGYSANQDFSAEVDNLYEDFKSNDSTGQFSGGGDSTSSLQGPSAENMAVNGSKPDIPNLADTPEAPKKRGF